MFRFFIMCVALSLSIASAESKKEYLDRLLSLIADTSLCEKTVQNLESLLDQQTFLDGIDVRLEKFAPENIQSLKKRYKSYDLTEFGYVLSHELAKRSSSAQTKTLYVHVIPFSSTMYMTRDQIENIDRYRGYSNSILALYVAESSTMFVDDFCAPELRKKISGEVLKAVFRSYSPPLPNYEAWVRNIPPKGLDAAIDEAEIVLRKYLAQIVYFDQVIIHEAFHYFQDQLMFKDTRFSGLNPYTYLQSLYGISLEIKKSTPDYFKTHTGGDLVSFMEEVEKSARHYTSAEQDIFSLNDLIGKIVKLIDPNTALGLEAKRQMGADVNAGLRRISHRYSVDEFSVRLFVGAKGYTDQILEKRIGDLVKSLKIKNILKTGIPSMGNLPADEKTLKFLRQWKWLNRPLID